jgi:hypothetical protein
VTESLKAVLSAAKVTPILADVGCSGARHAVWDPIASFSVLIAFDPDSREVPEDLAGRYRDVVMIDRAVADRDDVDTVGFVLTRYPYCSSTLEPNLEALGDYSFRDYFIPESRVSVQATSLNRVIDDYELPGIDWLKLDSQGTDLRIIRSLRPSVLGHMTALEVEPGLVDAYHGEDLFHDVHSYLRGQGYWLANLHAQAYPRVRPESAAELREMCAELGIPQAVEHTKVSPTAAEARYLRTMGSTPPGRSLVLLFVFALLDGHAGFALDVLKAYRDGDNEVRAAMRAALYDALSSLAPLTSRPSGSQLRRWVGRALDRL